MPELKPLGTVDADNALKSGSEKALAFLSGGGADKYLEASLVKYSAGRFTVGLDRYASILDRLGCAPGARLLDMGCGAGNWAIAHAIRSDDAAPTLAVDRRDGFVRVGADVARLLGLRNVSFECGSAEDGAMYGSPGTFDFILANGFLMFVNADKVLGHITRALRPGGVVYGNYTTAAGRIAAALGGIEKRAPKQVHAGMTHVLGSVQAGIGLRPRNSAFALTAKQLCELFAAWGFRLRESPGVHDWSNPGVSTGVYDFILDYDDKTALGEPSRLLEIGAQEAVLKATEGDESTTSLDLRARAMIARSGAEAGAALAERLPKGSTGRLVLRAQRFIEGATKAPDALRAIEDERTTSSEPHIVPFLTGVVLLQAGDRAGARRAFAEVKALRPSWLGGWAGEMLTLCQGKTELDDKVRPLFAGMAELADFDLQPQDTTFRRRAAALL